MLKKLHNVWDQKPINYKDLSQKITHAFANATNPYLTAMYLIQGAREYNKGRVNYLFIIEISSSLNELSKLINIKNEQRG